MYLFIIYTDDDLILFKNRDPKVLEKIFKEHKSKLFNYFVIKVNGDTHLAEDLFSDTMHAAIVSAPNIKDINKVYPWILSIANRKFIDHLRKKYRNQKYESNSEISDINIKHENDQEKLIENEKIFLMNEAMEKISPKYKKLLKLKYIENKSQKELSEILKKSESSIESLLFRARETLKKEMKKATKEFSYE